MIFWMKDLAYSLKKKKNPSVFGSETYAEGQNVTPKQK